MPTDDKTPLLDLPYLAAGQAQKHVSVNETLRRLDALVLLSVISATQASPPASPAEGDRFIIPAGAQGAWSGQAGKIACFQDGVWAFFAPKEGWVAWVRGIETLYVYRSNAWSAALDSLQNAKMIGINATADTINRLSLSSPATLLSHAGAGHQLTVNKAQTNHSASIVFQTNYSGRAEVGLAGNDDLSLKLSPNGSSWTTAMTLAQNGNIGIGTASPSGALEARRPAARMLVTHDGTGGSEAGVAIYARENPGMGNVQLGQVSFGARAGASNSQINSACIRAFSDGSWSNNTSYPTDMRFFTTPAGSTNMIERLRIVGSGRIGIGTATPTATLHVVGEFRLGSYLVANLPNAASSGEGCMVFSATKAVARCWHSRMVPTGGVSRIGPSSAEHRLHPDRH